MNQHHQTNYTKDAKNLQIHVTREFDAPVEQVWRAWTESELLDQWWAPKPYKAKTKSMDFREGGVWLYSMVGPDGTEQYCRADYDRISKEKSYSGKDGFCDKNGNLDNTMPSMHWDCQFIPSGNKTRVEVKITFATQEAMEQIITMGFQEGFAAAHNNLDEVLEKNAVAS